MPPVKDLTNFRQIATKFLKEIIQTDRDKKLKFFFKNSDGSRQKLKRFKKFQTDRDKAAVHLEGSVAPVLPVDTTVMTGEY